MTRRNVIACACLALTFVAAGGELCAQVTSAAKRQVAITIDDLPAGAAQTMSPAQINAMTTKLLGVLRKYEVPAVGFVNEERIYRLGELDARLEALRMWVDGGFELGNHTFSHTSLNRVELKTWEEDLVRGETFTRLLLAGRKMPLRYFRHPYLDMGRDLQTRREAEAFVTARGYQIAPVTLDAWDWMFTRVYEDAKKRGDAELERKVVDSYLAYSNAVFSYTEGLSQRTIEYEPKQILLLHANFLEADHIADLLELLRKRGYRFITLEAALSDPAYGLPDTYVGEGTGWIDHWAITLGKPPQGAPAFPQWVLDKANALEPLP